MAPVSRKEQGRTVSTTELKALLRHCIDLKRPAMIWGPPGIGKSEIIAQLAIEQKRKMIDLRLLLMEPTDLRGIPYLDPDTRQMTWSKPSDLPGKDDNFGHNALVFFDEISAAPQNVQSAALQLVLNRRIGPYELPPDVVMVAAGNRESDKTTFYQMPSALANRFLHYELRFDYKAWQEWAVQNDIHPHVIGYLEFQKANAFTFSPQNSSRAFATPRSWKFVSDLLRKPIMEKYEIEVPVFDHQNQPVMKTSKVQKTEIRSLERPVYITDSKGRTVPRMVDVPNMEELFLTEIVSSAVGQGVALEFTQWRHKAMKLPNPLSILNGEVRILNEDEKKDRSICYTLVISMLHELRDFQLLSQQNQWPADSKSRLDTMCQNFLLFVMKNFPTDMAVMAGMTAVEHYDLILDPIKVTAWDTFTDKYADFVLVND